MARRILFSPDLPAARSPGPRTSGSLLWFVRTMDSAVPVHDESPETPRILVVDDEQVIRDILCDFLTLEGYIVRAVEDGQAAMQELHRRSYNLVISDLKMPSMGGIELLGHIAEAKLSVLTIIMTGFGTVETA